MKITIEISDAQVKGLKDYLREVGDIENPKKEDIRLEVQNIVSGYFQAQHSSLTDYIQKYENIY
jgi:hypothetical protein